MYCSKTYTESTFTHSKQSIPMDLFTLLTYIFPMSKVQVDFSFLSDEKTHYPIRCKLLRHVCGVAVAYYSETGGTYTSKANSPSNHRKNTEPLRGHGDKKNMRWDAKLFRVNVEVSFFLPSFFFSSPCLFRGSMKYFIEMNDERYQTCFLGC